eukprot:152754_1
MANLSLVSVLVNISHKIIYYHQCIELSENIVDENDNKELEQKSTIIPENEEYDLPHDSYTLLNIINNSLNTNSIDNTSTNIINISIDSSSINSNIYKICYNNNGTLTVSILVCYSVTESQIIDAYQLENKVRPILNSIQYKIHKFFTISKQIPIYILRIRCHILIQKQLMLYKSKKYCYCNKLETISTEDMNKIQLEMQIYNKKTVDWTDNAALQLSNLIEKEEIYTNNRNWGGGHIIVYSITNRHTFEDAQIKYEQICRICDNEEDGCPPAIILIGNKCDLECERQISKQEGQELAKQWNVPFMETSAKYKINNIECFNEIVREIIRNIFEDPRDANMIYENNAIPEFKIIMQGSGGVGKSALTIRCITDDFVDEYDPTIEDSYHTYLYIDSYHKIQINILDTAGQQQFNTLQDHWIREATYKRVSARGYHKKKHAKQKRFIDNIFGDLENMFYLLSDLIYFGMNKGT